jgi:hypothetical protein
MIEVIAGKLRWKFSLKSLEVLKTDQTVSAAVKLYLLSIFILASSTNNKHEAGVRRREIKHENWKYEEISYPNHVRPKCTIQHTYSLFFPLLFSFVKLLKKLDIKLLLHQDYKHMDMIYNSFFIVALHFCLIYAEYSALWDLKTSLCWELLLLWGMKVNVTWNWWNSPHLTSYLSPILKILIRHSSLERNKN